MSITYEKIFKMIYQFRIGGIQHHLQLIIGHGML
jgi:hypothetical protein